MGIAMYKVSEGALDSALQHAVEVGDSDVFPALFEYKVIEQYWDEVRNHLLSKDLDSWVTRPLRTSLSPKGKFGYRQATQLDPLDSLLFTALTIEVAQSIEAARVDADLVHSYRYDSGAKPHLYSKDRSWSSFIAACKTMCAEPTVTHVVMADISDFYNRLPHHLIENALQESTNNHDAARVLFKKLIKKWTGLVSYGVPIGPDPSRLLAELTITDVDHHLLDEGVSFVRYVDDFRMFCTSERQAYDQLHQLAYVLRNNHGLSLQAMKTRIVTKEEFESNVLSDSSNSATSILRKKFSEMNIDIYSRIVIDNLSEDIIREIDKMDLSGIVIEQLGNGLSDTDVARFALDRLAQLSDKRALGDVIENAESLYPIFSSVVRYVASQTDLDADEASAIGGAILDLLESGSTVTHLPYHRAWLLSLFAESARWGHSSRLAQFWNSHSDSFTKRELLLAYGAADLSTWFRTHKDECLQLDPWSRRAFLFAAACRPSEERDFWYGHVDGQLDFLERLIVRYVKHAGSLSQSVA